MKLSLLAIALSLCTTTALAQLDVKSGHAELTAASLQAVKPINLNKADATELTNSISGIGKKRAEAIVKYRDTHGQFQSIDDLADVKGLGKQFVKRNKTQMEKVFVVK